MRDIRIQNMPMNKLLSLVQFNITNKNTGLDCLNIITKNCDICFIEEIPHQQPLWNHPDTKTFFFIQTAHSFWYIVGERWFQNIISVL